MSIFQRVILGLNVLVFAGAIISCAASYLDPQSYGPVALVSITFPVWISVNVVFIIFWLIAKIQNSLLSILAVLLCINSTQNLVQFNFHENEDKKGIKVISYNLGGYANSENITWYQRIGVLEELLHKMDADIYCLQENVDPLYELKGHEDNTYNVHRFDKKHGTSIYTKYPIVQKGKIDFGLITNSCVWVDVKINTDTLRVYSLHLQSNRISPNELEDLNDLNRDYKKNIRDTRGVLRKYSRQSGQRSRQLQMVLAHIARSPHRVIVGGDFNEPPPSYIYKQMRKIFKDSFTEQGWGVDGTFAGLLPYLRIDYIFTDPSIEVLSHETLKATKSDHFPVEVIMR